jgi:hypothetical protein
LSPIRDPLNVSALATRRSAAACHVEFRCRQSTIELAQDQSHGQDFRLGATYDYFEQDRSGTVHSVMVVLERSQDRVVLVSRNATSIRTFLGALFEAGALEATMILSVVAPIAGAAGKRTRAGASAGMPAISGSDSYLNRLVALFGYIAQRPISP